MVNLTINDQLISVPEGTSVLEAARKAGANIPTLCHDPELSSYGSCRLCMVEIGRNGRKTMAASCDIKVEPGMVVATETPDVLRTRKLMADLLLSRCPEVPKIQRIAASLGVEKPSFPTEHPEEDCILCGLCVRACDEKAGHRILGIVGRAPERRLTTAFGSDPKICDDCNKCIEYCPTGAITHLDAPKIGGRLKQKATLWKRARQVVQYAALLLFLGIIYLELIGQTPINIFARLNPLQAVAGIVGGRELIANYWPVFLTVGVTLVFGRVWCGWLCPLGGALEQYGRKGRKFRWQGFRQAKYVILYIVLIMAAFGSLAFLYFEPITIFVRGLTAIAKPALEYAALEDKKDFVIPSFTWWAIAIPFVLVLLLNLIERRFWCRYLCPLGALVGLGSKFSWIKRFVGQKSCVQCSECADQCTMGAISPKLDFKSDPAECIMCMDCGPVCPKRTITFPRGKMVSWNNEFDPTRREALASLGLGAAAIGLLFLDVGKVKAGNASVLRPPGAQGEDFLAKCIRCDQCLAVCPKKALVPAPFQAGWDSLYTPVLDPFSGGCDYECNRCGQICPTQAILPLSLEEKRNAVIGIAQVNFETCVRCMDCVQYCPYECFEEVTVEGMRGVFPKVKPDGCVGCGICVEVCPEQETRAIVVYPAGSVPEDKHATTLVTD